MPIVETIVPSAGTSSFSKLVTSQSVTIIPEFQLESGYTLKSVPVAFKTWGRLNEKRDNAMVICHAFTGSADVEDWWGPLMGPGKVFDSTRFFIFCGNVMGSPYGSASPVTTNPTTGEIYGPDFPLTTIRDDVRLHKLVLDRLGVSSIAVVIGGSMGGMAALEWPLVFPAAGYIRNIIPIATSSRHSAWCISWGEAERQSIYSDPAYKDGYYDPISGQPKVGLAAARMAALLTYRSRDSFESRFGRKPQPPRREVITPPDSPSSEASDAFVVHNDGHRTTTCVNPSATRSATSGTSGPPPTRNIFSAQSYLRYQGDKFTSRFDANCYIHITRKMDTHDISRDRVTLSDDLDDQAAIASVLSTLTQNTLVISIETDGLFTPIEQREIASGICHSQLITIPSPDGHDGFLLEFEQINRHILAFLNRHLPDIYEGQPQRLSGTEEGDFEIKKTSMFGEAEADITRW